MEINMKLIEKIAFIQNTVDGLSKDGKNPHFKNGYVTLNQIIDALRPMEIEQKLSITMPLSHVMGRPSLKLVITDLEIENEDNCITEEITLPDLTDPQKMGSAITYYRRYMLMSFFNLKSEDDDGSLASTKPASKPAQNKSTEQNKSTDLDW